MSFRLRFAFVTPVIEMLCDQSMQRKKSERKFWSVSSIYLPFNADASTGAKAKLSSSLLSNVVCSPKCSSLSPPGMAMSASSFIGVCSISSGGGSSGCGGDMNGGTLFTGSTFSASGGATDAGREMSP